jgi:diguanylate cyclase (GGDEF)-like protein
LGVYRFLNRQSQDMLLVIALAFMLFLGVIDNITGFEISFALFYLIPVSLAAWFAGREAGILVSIVSAATWYLANSLAGESFSNPLIPIWNSASRLGFFFIVTMLLSQLRRAIDHERTLSRTDYLTGALNSRYFYEIAQYEINKLQRQERAVTVIYIDLDNFKDINDNLGHFTGDEVLKSVVTKIGENIRAEDIVARLGGDEFAILLSETSQEKAYNVVSRLQRILLEEMERSRWPVTFSIGVLTITTPATVSDIIRQVDELMYNAKNSGKNAICYAILNNETIDEQPANARELLIDA